MSKWKIVAAALVLVGVAVACADWKPWDNMFKRDTLGSDTVGWTGGDGAMSVSLSGDRVLWLFGDSILSTYGEGGERTYPEGPAFVLGTTIGVQQGSAPDAEQIRFYQRRNGDGFDVTQIDGQSPDGSFFTHASLGLEPPATGAWLWPTHGVCARCNDGDPATDRLFVGLQEVVFCDDVQEPFCRQLEPDDEKGVQIISNVLAKITDIDGAPDDQGKWNMEGDRIGPGDVAWGSSFFEYLGLLISWGARFNPDDGTYDVVASYAQLSDLEDPGSAQWAYLMADGSWQARSSQPSADNLKTVARDVGAVFSLQHVVRHGIGRWMLLHAKPSKDHFLYVRSSGTPFEFDDLGPGTPKLDLVSIDDTLQWAILADQNDGTQCQTNPWETYNRDCAQTYHGLGHANLTVHTDGAGPTALLASYIVPKDGQPKDCPETGRESITCTLPHGRYYRPRFAPIVLDNLDPWCQEAGADCWRGIVHQFNLRQLDDGQQLSRVYDLSQGGGGEFLAQLMGVSGDLDLEVTVIDTSGQVVHSCSKSSADSTPRCQTTLPQDAWLAATTVTGRSDGSRYSLRVHYPGQ